MIISHTHRYVFVEMPRTGSRAVADELQQYYDGHEILRKHATYTDFERQATDDEKTYFSFSSVRNPLDVAVTRYAHLRANKDNRFNDPRQIALRNSLSSKIERRIHRWVVRHDADFEAFLLRWYALPYDTWTSLDHRRLDMVMRTETLADDFAVALQRIGIEPVRRLPVVNATPGREGDFVSLYTPKAIERAAWVFGPYMREWGYEFPASWGEVGVPWWSTVLMRIVRVPRMLYWKYLRFADYVKKRPGGLARSPRPRP
jgi:hypothetical protein